MNKDLKKFFAKILLLLLVTALFDVLIFLTGLLVIGCQYQGGYNASLIDKVARLKSIDEPKIILAGHSSLAFGINSPLLQNAMNMPVVNLGLHGGLGNAFHENIARLNINSGDIVVICHSEFSDDDSITDNLLAWATLEYHKDLWEILRPKDYLGMMRTFPDYWFRTFFLWLHDEGNKVPQGSYSRAAFNEYGDIVIRKEGKHLLSPDVLKNERPKVPAINDTCINRINSFSEYLHNKGATLLIAAYPIAYGEYTPPAEDYDVFQKELSERLDCEVISDYRDYFIPYEYCYDFILHLTAKGADIRTSQLIKDLQQWKAAH